MPYKWYTNKGMNYIIHHFIKYELLDWMEEYSQKIIDHSKESIVVTDLKGIVISVNPTFEQKMGYIKSEVIHKENKIFYVDEFEASEVTRNINDNGKIENRRTTVKTKDGKNREIELTAWIVKKGNENVIVRVSKFLEKTQILKSVIAITENILKAYEPEDLMYNIVKETAQLLESQFCLLYLVSKDNSELVLKATNDQEYLKKAKNMTYILDWNAKNDVEIDGITAWVAIRKKSFEANTWNEIINHSSHKGKLDLIYSSSGIIFKNSYAIPLIMDDQIKGVLRIENKIYGDTYTTVDKEIFELMGKYVMLVLEEQERLKKTVLYHIAHLTRSPIALAVMNLSLLEPNNLTRLSRFEFTESLRIIKNALMQANMTVTNLILWSTDSKGVHSGSARMVDMKELINKIIHSFEAYVKNNMRFKLDVKGNVSLSIPSEIKLEIILQNVIHNAIKYSKHINPIEYISVEGKSEGNYYKIKVRDNGIGMSKEDLKIIFNEFAKGESSKAIRDRYGSVMGLGIGLSSVKKICNEMEWQYDIYSQLGKGTTFTLILPTGDKQDGK